MASSVNRKQHEHSTKTSSKSLQYALLAIFLLALTLLGISNRILLHDLETNNGSTAAAATLNNANADEAVTKTKEGLLSVPPPRIRHPKNGNLPPPVVISNTSSARDKESPAENEAPPPKTNLLPPLPETKTSTQQQQQQQTAIVTFPLPSEAVSTNSKIILQPTFGTHRPEQNAVFAFAEGYDLAVYVTFLESLKRTGFQGDVVFAVSSIEGLKHGVKEYLEWYSSSEREKANDGGTGGGDSSALRVISYALPWECYKKSGVRILASNKEGRGSTTNHGFSDCKLHGMYSTDGTGSSPANDPREARPVATARYELYWIWSRQYHASSSMLILDVRDSYFQSNPFLFSPSALENSDGKKQSNECRLDLFEENFQAVDIGKSAYNSKWIKTAYGQSALKKISHKPVLCSGSTMGTQHAIELYTIAMVAQFDKSKCKQVGCDQGFHNYLFYEGSLTTWLASNDGESCAIELHVQGEGAVNNLAAMRNSSLRSQGVLKNIEDSGIAKDGNVVVNSDELLPSPVVHQFDRDDELKGVVRQRTSAMLNQWADAQKTRKNYSVHSKPSM